ncbi:MAG TPA: hypothetical protein DHV28_06675 [Ignavibacteriales bacterium]|nr:hypothetical protein [Ignavibacteriales bacterium]
MIVIDLIYNLSVLIALSVLSGFIDLRFNRSQLKGKIFQGLLFGLTSIVGMLYPFRLAEGIIFDGRSIIIGLCTLFFGPVSGSIASVLAILFRNYLGGAGALTGSLVIISSFLFGYYFYFRRSKSPEKNLSKMELYVFGVVINTVMLLLFLNIPYHDKLEMFKILTPTILGIYPFATLLIGKILLDQEENQSVLKKLKESEEFFRTTLYSIGDAVITTDISGNVKQMNSVAEKLTGWNESESKGKPLERIFNVVDEITKIKVESPLSKILREGTVVGLSNHSLLISKENKLTPISDSGAPIKNQNNETIGAVIVFRDQTQERIKQKELKDREYWLRESQRVGRIGSYELNIKEQKWIASEVLNEIFGISTATEKNVSDWYSIIHPDQQEEMMNYFLTHVVSGKNVFDKVYKIVRVNDGQERWVWGRGELKLDEDGSPIIMIGTIQDITENKKAQELLFKSEEKFRTVFETANEGICIVNVSDEITTVNAKFEEMVGYENSELIGKKFQMLISENDLENYRIRQLKRDHNLKENYERQLLRKDGSIIWTLVTVSHLLDESNLFTGSFGMFTDFTIRKKMEEDLLSAKIKAEESNKLKSNFLASMSHELRTPMVGILGFAEILENDIPNKEQKAMAATVLKSGKRLLDTLTSILDLSRIESGKEQIESKIVDVNLILKDLLNLFSAAAIKSKLFIKTQLEDNIRLELDERLFRDIITNLLNNAIKFTNTGGIFLRSFHQIENSMNCVIIEIEDTGIGIPHDKIDLIFDEFRQVSEGIGRNYEGTGLGLTLTKKYVELMNGNISVKSKVDQGTTFRIAFPSTVTNLNNTKNESLVTEKNISSENVKNFKNIGSKEVLVVENDEVSIKFLLRCLNNIAICKVATDGDEAIKLASEKIFDAIFMDINLGGRLDGIETTKEIRKLGGYSETPIVAVTAFAAEKDKTYFLENGCTHYISKPYFTNDLINLFHSLFSN